MLQNSILEYLEACSRKREAAYAQRWVEAAEIREVERKAARCAWESANGPCASGSEWDKYARWISEYCLEKYGTERPTREIFREMQLEKIGIK